MLSTEWQRIAQYAQLLPITYVSAPIHNSTPTFNLTADEYLLKSSLLVPLL